MSPWGRGQRRRVAGVADSVAVAVELRRVGELGAVVVDVVDTIAVGIDRPAAMISAAVDDREQGSALGANQSLQVGAEGLSGLAGGGLAAVSTSLPLPAMAVLAFLGSAMLTRPAARAAAADP